MKKSTRTRLADCHSPALLRQAEGHTVVVIGCAVVCVRVSFAQGDVPDKATDSKVPADFHLPGVSPFAYSVAGLFKYFVQFS